MTIPVALTIAGSDPSGGAGIQADLKTFHQHGVYGTSVITLLTVQNTRTVSRVEVMSAELVSEQLRALLDDVPPAAAKTGALGSVEVVQMVAEAAADFAFPLVVDPVMISKHGARLIDDEAAFAARDLLFRHATLVTPNIHEASFLCGFEVKDRITARDAAHALLALGPKAVLIKGGHLSGDDAVDLLFLDDRPTVLSAERVDSPHTHGTGCTYSAAITAKLAQGLPLLEAVSEAKGWLTEAIRNAPGIGHGIGPVDHLTPVTRHSVPPPG